MSPQDDSERSLETLEDLRSTCDHLQRRNEGLERALADEKNEKEALASEKFSFEHRINVLEDELRHVKATVGDVAALPLDEASKKRFELLAEDAEERDRKIMDTTERLRAMEVKANHYERKVRALENERDGWEQKLQESEQKLSRVQSELQEWVLKDAAL